VRRRDSRYRNSPALGERIATASGLVFASMRLASVFEAYRRIIARYVSNATLFKEVLHRRHAMDTNISSFTQPGMTAAKTADEDRETHAHISVNSASCLKIEFAYLMVIHKSAADSGSTHKEHFSIPTPRQ
jgi:hypothetical protein